MFQEYDNWYMGFGIWPWMFRLRCFSACLFCRGVELVVGIRGKCYEVKLASFRSQWLFHNQLPLKLRVGIRMHCLEESIGLE